MKTKWYQVLLEVAKAVIAALAGYFGGNALF